MKRTQSTGRTRTVGYSGIGILAEIVGHELNNISVPLAGFAELAIQSTSRSESVRLSLDEMRIAIDRIKALACDLQSLAEADSDPTRTAIGDCMPEQIAGNRLDRGKIDWRCSAASVILANRPHARRAIHSLGVIGTGSGSSFASVPQWIVSEGPAAAARCAACGARTRREDHFVLVQAYSPRPVTSGALRDPFGSARVGRADRRLTLAVLVHSTHCAGGHVFLDEGGSSVSLAFPVA